ncbi:hypothetical protein, partial [Pseudomonas spelaei]|uniref:hypothetical protein n=1 Tax=Pseudomonas spelaei TaxID=1055469 RepID=UPI001C499DEE
AASIITHDMTATRLFFLKRMITSTGVGVLTPYDTLSYMRFKDKRPMEAPIHFYKVNANVSPSLTIR